MCMQGNPDAPFSQAMSMLSRRVPLLTLNYSHRLSQAVSVGGDGAGQRIPLNLLEYCDGAGDSLITFPAAFLLAET